MNIRDSYQFSSQPPSVDDYMRLRAATGLSPRSRAGAEVGLPNSWFAVTVLHDGDAIGMGRIIGDGGCFFQIVDIAVLPDFQGQGLGRQIVAALMQHFETHAPEAAFLSLLADGEAHRLYAEFGFEATAPASIGMRYVRE